MGHSRCGRKQSFDSKYPHILSNMQCRLNEPTRMGSDTCEHCSRCMRRWSQMRRRSHSMAGNQTDAELAAAVMTLFQQRQPPGITEPHPLLLQNAVDILCPL